MIYIFTDENPKLFHSFEVDIGALWNEILRRQLFDAEVAIQQCRPRTIVLFSSDRVIINGAPNKRLERTRQ
jgi:hypothetical protein